MPNNKFYPTLSELFSIDQLPDSLGVVKDEAESLLSKIFYKDYIEERSIYGDVAFYKLALLTFGRVGVKIPGTGMSLLFNPDQSEQNATTLPITVNYNWPVVKYIQEFKHALYSSDLSAFFQLFLEIIDADKTEFLAELVSSFIDDPNPIEKFVSDFNTKYNPEQLVLPTEIDETVFENINAQIEALNKDVTTIIFSDYLTNNLNSFDDILQNLKRFFNKWLGDFDKEDVMKIITPNASFSLNDLSIALEFPSSVFRPIATSTLNASPAVPVGEALPEEFKTLLKFNVGSLNFSTENGFHFQNESSFDFQKSFIANTQFSLEIHNMKLDLSRTSNIPEADADGRPVDFVGVYVKDGSIGFPADWGHNEAGSTAELFVNNLLVGTGGISGTIGMRAKNGVNTAPVIACKLGGKVELSLTDFSLTFQQNEIIASTIKGKITLPIKGNTTTIDVTISIGKDGSFDIIGAVKNGVKISVGNEFDITIFSLEVGKKDGMFFFATAADLSFPNGSVVNTTLGITEPFHLQKLLIWENGRIELEGGTLPLPSSLTVPLGQRS